MLTLRPDPARAQAGSRRSGTSCHDRIAEAEREGWPGEIEGLKVSLAGTEDSSPRSTHPCSARTRPSTSACPRSPTSPATPFPARKDSNDYPGPSPALRRAARRRPRHSSPRAGTGLLIDCGSWLRRTDFTSRFITAGPSISDGATLLATIDWEAAITALHASELPASGGERRMLLLAASIAGGTPVSLNDALPGIDRRNASLVIRAVAHATGLPDPHQETDKRYLNG